MRKILNILIILCLVFLSMGCENQKKSSDKIQIITTVFAPYDFARQIAGDKADVSLLLDPGSEPHDFEPTPQDIIALSECDLFIYTGSENDVWAEEILKNNKNIKTLKLLDCVETIDEEIKQGMEHQHDEKGAPDDHVWTSPKNAELICEKIYGVLCEIDSENTSRYTENAEKYTQKLDALDKEFSEIMVSAKRKTLIFGDKFPVRYFTEEYGLDYYAAFPGCAESSEASPKTIAFLIDKVKSENIPVVFYIELSNMKTAKTICGETGAKPLLFHSAHNLSKEDFDKGLTFMDIMKNNANALREALN